MQEVRQRHFLSAGGVMALLIATLRLAEVAPNPPHVLFIVGDDVGYSDFGYFNDKKTITPTIDGNESNFGV